MHSLEIHSVNWGTNETVATQAILDACRANAQRMAHKTAEGLVVTFMRDGNSGQHIAYVRDDQHRVLASAFVDEFDA